MPQEHGSKYVEATALEVEGPELVELDVRTDRLVAVLAGRDEGSGVEAGSLVDLTGLAEEGHLSWEVPPGRWKLMGFEWRYSEGRRGRLLVDGASQAAVDWYLRTVYQPHYDHFADDFGGSIRGYFYDEPETHGDWGTEVIPMLEERGIDWKAALVAWKHELAGEDQAAYRYQYQDAFAEAWGRTLFGGIERWCREHGVVSIGHFLEHRLAYLSPHACAGNLFQLQKYSSMGGIDAVFAQFVMGQREARDAPTWQTPKLGSSISHAYGKRDDLAMVEIFGARGQDLSYREMKWWTDHMQVSGINFHIPHAFNPRSPNDRDCPPYFYNNGHEPRWPLYRVYADYTSRLSLMLSGGRHVCPVAFLYLGNSHHVGESVAPEDLTTALQDALFDCDWLPYEVFEEDTLIAGSLLCLRQERYRVLVVPAVEVIPFGTLARARDFLQAGGVVIGYGMLPSRSATPGRSAEDVGRLRWSIWGEADRPSTEVCRISRAGGRSYFLPADLSSRTIREVLSGDAGVHPTLEVLEGEPDDLLHVLHRVKEGRDVFFLCNQEHEGPAKRFELRVRAGGVPEVWDPLRNEIRSVPFRFAEGGAVELGLSLEPLESLLLVCRTSARDRPARIEAGARSALEPIPVERLPNPPTEDRAEPERSALEGCPWVWFAGDGAATTACTRYFRGVIEVDPDRELLAAWMELTADNDFVLYAGGVEVGRGTGGYEDWRRARTFDLLAHLVPGGNALAVAASNFGEQSNPAGLIGRFRLEYADGGVESGCIDGSWRASEREEEGWQAPGFDDSRWTEAREIAAYGASPWGRFDDEGQMLTLSPVEADPFDGRFELPEEWVRGGLRIYLEAEGLDLGAAAVRVNGEYAGGFIGAPHRLDVTERVVEGANALRIEPRAPHEARIVAYPGGG